MQPRKQMYIVTDRFTMIEYRCKATSPERAMLLVILSTDYCALEDLEARPMWSPADLKMLEDHNRQRGGEACKSQSIGSS